MNKNLKVGILIMLICTLFTAAGQLFFKYGSESFKWNIIELITNYNLILGFVLYGIGALLLIIALRFGELSVIYPFVSLTFIWVTVISFWFLGEQINNFKIGAVIFIVLGVSLIAWGSNDEK
jgi:drug/metabolite transporter (DMT)-like permease